MYFQDFKVGQKFQTGSYTLTEDEIIAFAKRWDKQPFHLDPEAAKASIYGGLIASGWHTLLIAFDLVVETRVWTECSAGSPGMENVRWLKPVRPGDSLSVTFKLVGTRPSGTRDDRGYLTWDHWVHNQSGEVVASYRSVGIALTGPA